MLDGLHRNSLNETHNSRCEVGMCGVTAEEQNQREGDGRPEPGGGVCPSCAGFLREPLRPVPQLEASNLRVTAPNVALQ